MCQSNSQRPIRATSLNLIVFFFKYFFSLFIPMGGNPLFMIGKCLLCWKDKHQSWIYSTFVSKILDILHCYVLFFRYLNSTTLDHITKSWIDNMIAYKHKTQTPRKSWNNYEKRKLFRLTLTYAGHWTPMVMPLLSKSACKF